MSIPPDTSPNEEELRAAVQRFQTPAPKCKDCFRVLVDDFSIAYGQCTPCNHQEAKDQLLDWLRRQWRTATESQRACIEAWAMHIERRWS